MKTNCSHKILIHRMAQDSIRSITSSQPGERRNESATYKLARQNHGTGQEVKVRPQNDSSNEKWSGREKCVVSGQREEWQCKTMRKGGNEKQAGRMMMRN